MYYLFEYEKYYCSVAKNKEEAIIYLEVLTGKEISEDDLKIIKVWSE